jgi:hypothetical protein
LICPTSVRRLVFAELCSESRVVGGSGTAGRGNGLSVAMSDEPPTESLDAMEEQAAQPDKEVGAKKSL